MELGNSAAPYHKAEKICHTAYESKFYDCDTRVITGFDSMGNEVMGTHYYVAFWFYSTGVGYEIVIEDEVMEDWDRHGY